MPKSLAGYLFPFLLLVLASIASAQSAIPVYYADASRLDDSGDGRSWATAKKTLQAAIDATTSAHQVWARQGRYGESVTMRSGLGLYGGFSGQETRLEERATSAALTVIEGSKARGGQPAYHVVTMINSITTATLSGFTVTGGVANGAGAAGLGGGIYCWSINQSNIIENCSIIGNSATTGGGGLYLYNSSPQIRRCLIVNNQAATGGGAYGSDSSALIISDSRLTRNSASGNGGSVAINLSSSANLLHCSLTESLALNGGALFVKDGSVKLAQCQVAGNHASNMGGAIYRESDGVFGSPSVALDRCVLACNSAVRGGALATKDLNDLPSPFPSWFYNHGSFFADQCLLVGNSATSDGAAVYCNVSGFVARNCTISHHAGSSGAIYANGNFNLQLSKVILADNEPTAIYTTNGPAQYAKGFFSLETCLFKDQQGTAYQDSSGLSCLSGNDLNMNFAGAKDCRQDAPGFVMDSVEATTGTWTTASLPGDSSPVPLALLSDAAASFTPGRLAGRLIMPNVAQPGRLGLIVDNTTTSVLVANYPASAVKSGDTWKLADYHLANGSPAIDQIKQPVSFSTDLDGQPRPGDDQAWDLGAYEAPDSYQHQPDTTAPESLVKNVPDLVSSPTLAIAWQASDGQGPLSAVALYYRHDGGAWTRYADEVTSPAQHTGTFSFDITKAAGQGTYEFYSIAIDRAGNSEPAPATPDERALILISYPAPQVRVDSLAQGNAIGLDWENACPTIASAMAIADRYGVKEIWVARGRYEEPVIFKPGVAMYGGFEGVSGARESTLGQRDPARNPTILAGEKHWTTPGQTSSPAVLMSQASGAVLDGFSIQTAGKSNVRGGIRCENTSGCTVRRCTIRGNNNWSYGPFYAKSATLDVSDCDILGNASTGNGGGFRLLNCGGTIRRCRILGNLGAVGGGMYPVEGGGGLYINGAGTQPLTISECVIRGNQASGSTGGGVYCYKAFPSFINCQIIGNSYGGVLVSACSPSFNYCTIAENRVGVMVIGGGAAPTLNGCIITGHKNHGLVVNEALSQYEPRAPIPSLKLDACLLYGNKGGDLRKQQTGDDPNPQIVSGAQALRATIPDCGRVFEGDPRFQRTTLGEWTTTAPPTISNALYTELTLPEGFAPGQLKDCLIILDQNRPDYQTVVLDNTATKMLVSGDWAWLGQKNTFALADYHLADGSAALDHSVTPTTPAQDFEGDPRPGPDGLVDLGADEADAAFVQPSDTTPPVSQVNPLPPAVATTSLAVPFAANDTLSGVREVALYYRYEQGAWTRYQDTSTSAPIPFDSSRCGGDGHYEFYTVATDQAGQVEAAPARADAATIFVTRLPHGRVYVNPHSVGAGNGTSWADACSTISVAVDLASQLKAPEVWVVRGVYSDSVTMRSGVALLGGFAGGEVSQEQRDPALNPTVIDAAKAQGGRPARHVLIMNGITTATVDGFTLRGGFAPSSLLAEEQWSGGGVYATNIGRDCRLAHCRITGNYASRGGGLFLLNASPTIRQCNIGANESDHGAALYARNSAPVLEACQISANQSQYSMGGCIAFEGGNSTPQMTNCLISGNATPGGVVYCNGSSPTLLHCSLVENQTSYNSGALHLYNSSWPVVTNTIINGNYGYGIYMAGSSTKPTFNKTLLYNNYAAAASTDPSKRIDYYIYNFVAFPGSQIQNCVAASPNFVPTPSGVWSGQSVTLADGKSTRLTCATAEFKPGALAGRLITPNTASLTQRLIRDNTTNTVIVEGVFVSPVTTGTAWRLVDYHLGLRSAAIDAGTSSGLKTDLEGRPRPFDIPAHGVNATGGEYDIGAYEAQRQDLSCLLTLTQKLGGQAQPATKRQIEYYTTVTLTSEAPGFHFVRWSGDVPAGQETSHPLRLLMDRDRSLTVTLARDLGQVQIDATPDSAPWTLVDAEGQTRQGVGDQTLSGIPTGRITLTWAPLADYDLPATITLSGTVVRDNMLRLSATYTRQRGVVVLQPSVPAAGWSLSDALQQTHTGIGPARLADLPAGTATLTWKALDRYDLPAMNPVQVVVATSQTTTVTGLYVRHLGTVRIDATPENAPWGLVDGDGHVRQGVGDQVIAGVPTGQITLTWQPLANFDHPANPIMIDQLLRAGQLSFSGRYARQTGTVQISPTPGQAAWELLDGDGQKRSGQGAQVLEQVPTGLIRLTWQPLALFDLPASAQASGQLTPAGQLIFQGRYTRQCGALHINVSPAATQWTVVDSEQGQHSGAGTALLEKLPTGPLQLTWRAPAGYDSPTSNPVTLTLAKDQELWISEALLPTGSNPERTRDQILNYLLGLSRNPGGLDLNADGRVDVADLQKWQRITPPPAPANPAPASGAVAVALRPHLDWADCRRARAYDLYLWPKGASRPAQPTAAGLAVSQHDVSAPLDASKVYQWQVVALGGEAGVKTEGPLWSFTTDKAIRLLAPNGGESWTRGQKAQLTWKTEPLVAGTTVRLELWRTGQRVATLVASSTDPSGQKTETITVPASLTPATDYKVVVFSPKLESAGAGLNASDSSDAVFTIK